MPPASTIWPVLYNAQGDYARAEPLYRQALEIKKKALGENHPEYATSLNNLAWLYACQGDYVRAEPLYRQALEIKKKALGENHPDYAASLNNLAELYKSQGDYARAEPLCRQALEIRKKALGENHPDYAVSLGNLALLYTHQGDYARAEPLMPQALEIAKKALGENHPAYADSLNNLALLYCPPGRLRAGRTALPPGAGDLTRRPLGRTTPTMPKASNNLAALYYYAQGDYARAEPLLRQAVLIRRRQLEATAVVQSERQQLAMLQSVRSYLDHYLALTAGQDQFSASAYQQMLAWKGMVFRRQRLARAGEQTPELAALFQQLQQVAGQLAKQAWATPDPQASGPLAGERRAALGREGTPGGGTLRPQRRLSPGPEAGHPGRTSAGPAQGCRAGRFPPVSITSRQPTRRRERRRVGSSG